MEAALLTIEEFHALEDDGLLLVTNNTQKGKRKVSGAFLAPPTSAAGIVGSSGLPLSGSKSFKTWSRATECTINLPLSAESPEAMEFVGFESQTARLIYKRWNTRTEPEENPNDLLAYALGHVAGLDVPNFRQFPDDEAMQKLGIQKSIRNAILDPEFEELYHTQTLHYWVKDTIRDNYYTLLHLQERLKSRARRALARKKLSKRPRIQDASGTASSAEGEGFIGEASMTHSATINDGALEENLLKHCDVVRETPAKLSNHTVVYKVKSPAEIYFQRDLILEDGSLDMGVLATHSGGDFNAKEIANYWTTEKDTAEYHRRYAAQRKVFTESWIIQIQVPNDFLQGLNQEELWFSKNWKEYVWWSKRGQTPPARLEYLWKHADVITGHLCKRVSPAVQNIKPDEVQDRITEDMVLRVNGRKATQSVFMREAVYDRLGEVVRGKLHIEVTAPMLPPGESDKGKGTAEAV